MARKRGTVLVGAFVEPPFRDAVVAAARRSERTLAGEIRFALRQHLRGVGIGEAAMAGEGSAANRGGRIE